jgi:hypothetical protein
VIDAIQGGTPLFAYYPDAAWLDGSRFLGRCVLVNATPSPAPRATPKRRRG